MADYIKAKILKKADGLICGFEIKDHGDPIVCSGVSVLTMNTINSLEAFTNTIADVDMADDAVGGALSFTVDNYDREDVQLLLKSLELGLKSIELEYTNDIKVFDWEVQ
jgi:uncharacterized protein YsxB (DUF464 family)